MPQINVSFGDNFRDIREEHCYYVDKTGLIEELLQRVPPTVSLFTRPRRFGKTLTLSMLREFFDISKDSRNLFAGLYIASNTDICNQWMNQYPVISISFKDIDGSSREEATKSLVNILQEIMFQHAYLIHSDKVSPFDKETLFEFSKGNSQIPQFKIFIRVICRALECHWGKKTIVLIDEYDSPINKTSGTKSYEEINVIFRTLLSSSLKDNPSLKFAILTGCLYIAKESFFSGVNNFKCFSISNYSFSDKFGFTSSEVDQFLQVAGFQDKKNIIKEWFDGYIFGKTIEIFCPWDVVQYVYDLQGNSNAVPVAYWKNSSDNAIVRSILEQSTFDTRSKIEELIHENHINVEISENLTFDELQTNTNSIWSIFYSSGYLTKTPSEVENVATSLVIPNKEVKTIFIETIISWFKVVVHANILPLLDALWKGDVKTVHEKLNDILVKAISCYDSAEKFYHGFMTGLFSATDLQVSSNRESGDGRPDIVVTDRKGRSLVFELKRAESEAALDAEAREALAQAAGKRYAEGPHAAQETLRYGISFWKKRCAVRLLGKAGLRA